MCNRDNSNFIRYIVPKSFAGYNFHTVWDNLIILDRDIQEVKEECCM